MAALVLALLVQAAPRFGEARPDPVAEALFHQEPRWLGADAAITVQLDAEHTLWLFGDTFVATSEKLVRNESTMVRNTVALQTGLDLEHASLAFHWGHGPEGEPRSFFPEQGQRWLWPGGAVRLPDGPLALFLYVLVATPGEGLGFAGAGFELALVDDPLQPPDSWHPRYVSGPELPFDAEPATAAVVQPPWLVALAIRQKGGHAGAFVRYPLVDMARGDLSGAEWWCGEERGWLAQAAVPASGPAYPIEDAGAECSLHYDAASHSWLHVASYGFGASTIGLRSAPSLTGPWSPPTTLYTPPESRDPNPFVYAAKAHPELAQNGALLVTYATNSFEFADLFTAEGRRALHWPRVVRVPRLED